MKTTPTLQDWFLTTRLVQPTLKGDKAPYALKVGSRSLAIADPKRAKLYRRGILHRVNKIGAKYGAALWADKLPGARVIDIGANIGEFSLYCAGRKAGVIAIEPDVNNLSALQQNTQGTGIFLHNNALWHETKTLTFYSAVKDADSSLIEPEAYEESYEVKALPLDTLLAEERQKPILLIKMDAEGAEPEVLKGASETLQNTALIAIDCTPERQGVSTMQDCLAILAKAGFARVSVPGTREDILIARNENLA